MYNYSHAEGSNVVAYGQTFHAEGHNNGAFAYRNKKAGTKEFHVEKEIKEKLAQSFSSNTI